MSKQHLVHRILVAGIAGLFLMGSYSEAQQVNESELQFREALHKQQVEGDLAAAMKLYQNIAGSKTADRAVKAKALLQLAACYEKLGRQADSVYQQIVRDFADQPAAIQARAKIAASRPAPSPSTITLRKVEMGKGVQNVVATDGQRAVYWDDNRTTLLFGDVAGKTKKTVFTTTPDRQPNTYVSRDLSTVFFYFSQSRQSPETYAIVKTDGTGYRNLDLVENGVKLPPARPMCLSWSRDNRYVFLCRRLSNRTIHPFKVSIADGQTVDIVPTWTKDIIDAVASPDDRYIALNDDRGPIYVVPAHGGETHIIAEDAGLADWTDDGRYFVFGAPDQNKAFSTFAIAMKDGQPVGDRIFIRTVEKSSRPTAYGSSMVYAYMAATPAFEKVYLASFETEDRLSPWKPLEVVGPGGFYPTWSPDAGKFAYVAHTLGDSASVVRIYTLAGGEDRELYRSKDGFLNCAWASQHPVVYCGQFTVTGKTDIVAIGTETGRAEKLRSFDGTWVMRNVSPDNRILNMANLGGGMTVAGGAGPGGGMTQWEIGTDTMNRGPNFVTVSPDGRWEFRNATDAEGRREFQIRSTTGTAVDWKHLVYLRRQAALAGGPIPTRYTADSKWLIYHDQDSEGKDGIYRVPPSGGEPQRLGDYPTSRPNSQIEISADGQKLLVNVAAPRSEIPEPEFWLMQNFIPATKPAAR